MRSLDHLVMPTADLTVARARLESLGFTVAPQGDHPFGTINACVYLADGTFFEPLAIGDRPLVDLSVKSGNNFVVSDKRFRDAAGEEGFSGLVFSTTDADADDLEFRDLGISGGGMVEFSRPAIDMSGRSDIASFVLAFAATPVAPDLHFFTCERRKAPKVDRSELERHDNGARVIVAITATSHDPEACAEFLAKAARSSVTDEDGTMVVALNGAKIRVLSGKKTHLTSVTFAVDEVEALKRMFSARAIGYEERNQRALTVPATAGQGADFIFEEIA